MGAWRSTDLVDKPHVGTAGVGRVERGPRAVGYLRFCARLDFKHNLHWRVESVQQPAKCVYPAVAVRFRGAGKAERFASENTRVGGAIPKNCGSPRQYAKWPDCQLKPHPR
ncbi:MAG TPA: hypothetical protein VIO34_10555 [Candidatus Dormibacteraeota bacterium]